MEDSEVKREETAAQFELNTSFSKTLIKVNDLLAKDSLPCDKNIIEKWLKVLQSLNKSETDRKIRLGYIWFLLVQLENGAVDSPFINDPPAELKIPVHKFVDPKLYREILQTAHNRSKIEDPTTCFEEISPQEVKPSNFLEKLPVPRYGIIVYGSCFSNQSR